MIKTIQEQNAELNTLYRKHDDLYHSYAVHWGFSDSAFWILYALFEAREAQTILTQNELAEYLCLPKQTINSAVSGLMKSGWVLLKHIASSRNRKAVCLTESGLSLCQEMIAPVFHAEQQAIARMSDRERELYLQLCSKEYSLFENEMERLMQTIPKNR